MKNTFNEKNLERGQKIIELYNKGRDRQDILEILELTTNFKVTQAIIDNTIRLNNQLNQEEEYSDKKMKSLERSKLRLSDENTVLRREIRNLNREENKKTDYTELIRNTLSNLTVTNLDIKVKKVRRSRKDWAYFSSTDWHIGKAKTELILKKIAIFKEDILSSKESNITFAMLGDLWENLSQVPMHSGQLMNMEILTLQENMDLAVSIFSDLIDSITKVKNLELVLIGGNHDRVSSKNEDDLVRTGMFMLKNILEAKYLKNKNLTIIYNTSNRVVLEKEGVLFDLGHGEYNFNKDKLEVIRQKNNFSNDSHVIRNSGHRHTAKLENARDITRVITPAFAGVGDYDDRLDLSSNDGYTRIRNVNGLIKIEIALFSSKV